MILTYRQLHEMAAELEALRKLVEPARQVVDNIVDPEEHIWDLDEALKELERVIGIR